MCPIAILHANMTVLSRLFVPTQSKRLNELVGILLIATAVLMLLALASYSPLDRSLNTAINPPVGRPAHNWIGLVGAYSADLMLQATGRYGLPAAGDAAVSGGALAAFARWSKIRSLKPRLRSPSWLLPARCWRCCRGPCCWMHAIPIEGLLGRLLGDLLVHYLNYAGAYIVVLTAIAAALYLSTAFSLSSLRLWMQTRFTLFYALRDRFQDWRQRRAKAHELKLLAKKQRLREEQEEAAAIAARSAESPARAAVPASASSTPAASNLSAAVTITPQAEPVAQLEFPPEAPLPLEFADQDEEQSPARALSGIERDAGRGR